MAATSTSHRATAGIAFIVAGALFVLAAILPLLNVSFPLAVTLAEIAVVIGFAILAIGAVNSTLAKVALWAAAAGWAILVIASVVKIPNGVVTLAALVAAIAGVVAAVVLYMGKEIRNRPAVAFIVATALGALYLLGPSRLFSLGQMGVIVLVLFGAALIVTGVLFRRREGSRR